MITSTIPIRLDNASVVLEAYVLKHSLEFQTDTRRPAVIICPGGGYMRTSDREAEPIALRFLARGYHAFVLRYSVQTPFPQPMLDLARAILTVREQADAWFIDADSIAVCGFSAGGHLAASVGVLWHTPLLHEKLGVAAERIKPNALILGYPVIDLDLMSSRSIGIDPASGEVINNHYIQRTVFGAPSPTQELKDHYRADLHVSSATPPTFIWHTADDDLVLAQNVFRFATALAEHKIPYELHIFESGVHGLSLADETTDEHGQFMNAAAQVWIDLALRWLRRQREQMLTSTAMYGAN